TEDRTSERTRTSVPWTCLGGGASPGGTQLDWSHGRRYAVPTGRPAPGRVARAGDAVEGASRRGVLLALTSGTRALTRRRLPGPGGRSGHGGRGGAGRRRRRRRPGRARRPVRLPRRRVALRGGRLWPGERGHGAAGPRRAHLRGRGASGARPCPGDARGL